MLAKRVLILLSLCLLIGSLAVVPATAQDGMSEFVFAHSGPIRSMDAHSHWFISSHWLTNLLYDCLIWRAPEGGGYVPQAAQSWELVDDTTWRFHLREGATFHNGEPLDAHAVKWNIDRVRVEIDPQIPLWLQWRFVKDTIVVDDLTIDITTEEPHAYFENDVSFNGCELLPPQYFQEVGQEEFIRNPVGSGPYKLAEFTENDRYVFEAWDDYHSGRPEVDRVIYQVIPEASAQVAALLAGQVDLIASVPVPDRERLEQTEGISLLTETRNRMHHLRVRTQAETGAMAETHDGYQPATMDVNVRWAITHALDRHLLAEVQGAAEGRLARVCSYHPEGYAERYADPDVISEWYNPDLAREYLAKAGFAEGEGPTVYFDTMNNRDGNEKEVAEVVKIMLEEVGFTVDLTVRDTAAHYSEISTPGNNRDIMMTSLGCSVGLLPLFYQCSWEAPRYRACEEEWDAIAQSILTTHDYDTRLELWGQWWEHYMAYQGTVTLYEMTTIAAMNTAEFDFTLRKDGWMTFRDLKLADGM